MFETCLQEARERKNLWQACNSITEIVLTHIDIISNL